MRYHNIDLRIDGDRDRGYRVEVDASDTLHLGEAQRDAAELDADDPDLSGALDDLAARRIEQGDLERLGRSLYERLMGPASSQVSAVVQQAMEESPAARTPA